jgi:hypothetical protein
MEFNIQIGKFAEAIEEYKNITLKDNQEVDIRDLGCKVDTPTGPVLINQIIKKENLSGIKLTLESGVEVKCARFHILRHDNSDIYAKDLKVGDLVDTTTNPIKIVNIENISDTTFYDISIPYPHLYYDADGVLHHNTITTATLSKICEDFGRTLVIVPNKSLITQTEDDYRNCGLDVGVYYGDRKELGKTHTICTWQSLNILEKKGAAGDSVLTLAEFLEDIKTVIVDECFDGDVLITTPTGKIPIKKLKAGDKVINLCEETHQFKEDTIVKVHKNLTHSQSEKMLELEFDNGVKIQVTANHKFLTNKGWIRADQLTDDLEVINISTYN